MTLSGTSDAAAVVIGDEILSGKIRDGNGPYLIEKLRAAGVSLRRLLTVGDTIEEIAWAVAGCRAAHTPIFTSGGIGPTHDDRTVAGVAAALGREVVQDPSIAAGVRAHFGAKWTEEAMRLANVPAGAQLLTTPGSWYPVIMVEEIYLLPGVPQLFRMHLDHLITRFRGEPFHLRCVYVSVGETQIAAVLDRVSREHPLVALGSYPRFDEADHRVKLTLEAQSVAPVERALEALLALLPSGVLVRTE